MSQSKSAMCYPSLNDKVVLVTGASGGIGEAITRRLLEEGAKVAALGRHKPKNGTLNISCDVGSDKDVKESIENITAYLGSPDIVIHAAAISKHGSSLQSTPEDFAEVYNVNVIGAVRLVQGCAHSMIDKEKGNFIFISSINADFATPTLAAYAASKGALNNFTKTVALEMANKGVRVNAISPASIDTPLLQDSYNQHPDPVAARNVNIARHPLGRLGTPQDVANLALFLASDHSDWITGSIYLLDGGAHIARQ